MRTPFVAIAVAGLFSALSTRAVAQASDPDAGNSSGLAAVGETLATASADAGFVAPAVSAPAAPPAMSTPPPLAPVPAIEDESPNDILDSIPDPFADVDFNILHKGKFNLDVGAMGQVLGLGQIVDDPYTPNGRVFLFLPKARLRLDGSYDRISFNLMVAMGGEDTVAATSGIDFGLLDLALNIPLTLDGKTYLKVGQFLVPYGREQLTDPGFQSFADTSVEEIGFVVGRDVGLALVSQPGPFTLIGGVFTGGGRDVPPDHYLPERFGIPELVARIGIGDLDKDPFYLRQSDPTPDRPRYQLSVSGLFTRDSTIGHSTVLNVKSEDKSILIDSAWNPYISEGGTGHFSQGNWYQVGADAAARTPLGGGLAAELEAQYDHGGYSNGYGSIQIDGVRGQASLTYTEFELALRYDVLFPSSQFANSGVKITGGQPIQELAPAATWYIFGNRLKVIADLPLLFNAPIFTEPHVGEYVGTQLQDEATVLASTTGGTATRQFVAQGRLMLQGQF